MPRNLFLPDPRRHYDGREINNFRRPLDRDPAIKRFCELGALIHRGLNEGELAFYHGEIELTPTIQRYHAEREQLGARLRHRYGANRPEGRE